MFKKNIYVSVCQMRAVGCPWANSAPESSVRPRKALTYSSYADGNPFHLKISWIATSVKQSWALFLLGWLLIGDFLPELTVSLLFPFIVDVNAQRAPFPGWRLWKQARFLSRFHPIPRKLDCIDWIESAPVHTRPCLSKFPTLLRVLVSFRSSADPNFTPPHHLAHLLLNTFNTGVHLEMLLHLWVRSDYIF